MFSDLPSEAAYAVRFVQSVLMNRNHFRHLSQIGVAVSVLWSLYAAACTDMTAVTV